MASSWIITGATLADADAIATTNLRAFWPKPNFRLSWPTHKTFDSLLAQKRAQVPSDLLHNPNVLRHLTAIDPITGRIVGYARYALPPTHARADVWANARMAEVSPEEKARIDARATDGWPEPFDDGSDQVSMEIQKRILDGGNYLKLRYLAVDPEYQRRGVGTALIKAGIRMADELGLDLYVMGSGDGWRVYEQAGFRKIEEHVEDLANYGAEGEWLTTFLLYDAKKAEGNAIPAA